MTLRFITGNAAKFVEAKSVIPELEQMDLDLDEIQAIDPRVVIEHKLNQAVQNQEGSFVIEDNSLFLKCLNGLPGPLIKWFLKTVGNEGLVKMASTFGDDTAEARVVVGYRSENGEINYFEGIMTGKIVEPRGTNGFGWDPVFQPDGETKTYGEMTLEEKNVTSCRKTAFQKLKEYIDLSK